MYIVDWKISNRRWACFGHLVWGKRGVELFHGKDVYLLLCRLLQRYFFGSPTLTRCMQIMVIERRGNFFTQNIMENTWYKVFLIFFFCNFLNFFMIFMFGWTKRWCLTYYERSIGICRVEVWSFLRI